MLLNGNSDFQFGGCSDIGRRREFNEDRILMAPESCFFAVIDGMGQLPYGKETAEMTCTFMKQRAGNLCLEQQEDPEAIRCQLKAGLESVSNRIFSMGNTESHYRYGAAFCGVFIALGKLIFLNMGDSRAYVRYRDGEGLYQITQDHNLAQTVVSAGIMTREEACKRHLDSRLNNFVGVSRESEADSFLISRELVQSVLICSDGLYGMVSDEDILQCISDMEAKNADSDTICRELVYKANEAGGRDNISVIYIQLTDQKRQIRSEV
ncbi:MAG: protein phosphatase 2C domain-containing protein [Lachnospiraceae bacterium]|nr:protein phosphatase 2C domain-containing protein [Lachnospiraceae bacterium]